jgi:ketosteroid isomerase-like protein
MRRTITVAAVMLIARAAAVSGDPPKMDPARAAIEKVGRAFSEAFGRGDFAGIARMYSEDAILFPPETEMVKGRAGIEAFWKGARDTGVKAVDLNTLDVTSSGNVAAETGTAVLHVLGVAGGSEALIRLKYVVVWRKEGAVWRLYRDIWNSLPGVSAPPAPSPPATTPPH